ncbi:Battenin, partial [Fasciola gigantica]
YFCLLNRPDHPKFRVSFACCRSNATRSSLLTERISHYSSLNSPEDRFGADTGSHSQPSRCDVSIHPNKEYEVHIREVVPNTEIWDTCSVSSESALAPDAGTHQDASLAGLLIYLSLVYFFEYLINQSLFELLHFENSIPDTQQYRWYQVLYQTGVFFSRSSVNLVQLRRTWIMAILQAGNFALCLTQVIYQYIPSIWIMCVIILYEGCLGGLAYVNTFYRIIQEASYPHALCFVMLIILRSFFYNTAPAYREYAMSFATIADSIGITVAGFLAIPLHHWLCTVLR